MKLLEPTDCKKLANISHLIEKIDIEKTFHLIYNDFKYLSITC